MPFFPVALNLQGRSCVVIGRTENRETREKAAALEECGALVRRLHDPQNIRDEDLRDAFLVISTIKSAELSARLQRLSQEHRFLLCCIDQPAYSSVSMMAIARAGTVQLAVSTSGVAPSVSKALRHGLARAMDERFLRFVNQLGTMRRKLRERLPEPEQAQERVNVMLDASEGFEIAVDFSYPPWFGSEDT